MTTSTVEIVPLRDWPKNSAHMKWLSVSPEFITQVLGHNHQIRPCKVVKGLPTDARILGLRHADGRIQLLIESRIFESTSEDEIEILISEMSECSKSA